MLIIKRSERIETIIELLQSFLARVSQDVGIADEKQGIMMTHSLMDTPLFNLICGYEEPANVLNVAALLENAKRQEKSFLWLTHDANIHLEQYLRSEGLDKTGSLQGCYYKLSTKAPEYTSHPAVSLNEVDSDEKFFEWCHVFAVCHGLSVEDVEAYFKSGYGENRGFQMYTAQVYQKTIGCCVLYTEGNRGLLLWDSVLPMYRRQGVGSMMVLNRMQTAKTAGCEHIYAFGDNSYLQLLRSLGFKAFAKFNLNRFDHQNTVEHSDG